MKTECVFSVVAFQSVFALVPFPFLPDKNADLPVGKYYNELQKHFTTLYFFTAVCYTGNKSNAIMFVKSTYIYLHVNPSLLIKSLVSYQIIFYMYFLKSSLIQTMLITLWEELDSRLSLPEPSPCHVSKALEIWR